MRRFEHRNRRRPENQAAPGTRLWSAVGAVRRFNPRLQVAANEAVISGGPAFVAMMQSANFGERNDVALLQRLDSPRLGSILVQTQMRSAGVVI